MSVHPSEARLTQHLLGQIPTMLKKPAACLRKPFIDPGSIYEGNLWDWDSFWAVYGLFHCLDTHPEWAAGIRDQALVHAKGNVENFLDHQEPDGYIPMMIEVKDQAVPYLIEKHRQGHVLNMHKPFLCQQAALIAGWSGDKAWLEGKRAGFEAYLACYDRHYYHEKTGLYVWADDVMIGMDNDPATFGRPRFSTANVFLNFFLVKEFRAMAKILELQGAPRADQDRWRDKAGRLERALQAECWDRRDRFFYSADVDVKTRPYDWFHQGLGVIWNSLPIKVRAWSGFLALWSGTADAEQAADLARHAADPQTFLSPSGITSLAMDEKMYDVRATNNPSNWLGPIWIIVQYLVFRGLLDYGFRDQAEDVARRTLDLLGRDLEKTGTLHEYYDPLTGLPVMNGGFINWNILVLNMADELRGAPSLKRFLE